MKEFAKELKQLCKKYNCKIVANIQNKVCFDFNDWEESFETCVFNKDFDLQHLKKG